MTNKWLVGITTAPRKRVTFSDSLTSLLKAGWRHEEIVVAAEPGSVVCDDSGLSQIIYNRTKLGVFANWRMLLNEVAKHMQEVDVIALVQDDMQYATGLKKYLEETMRDDPAIYSPYTSRKDAFHAKPTQPGWFRSVLGWDMCGACTYVMRPEMVSILNNQFVESTKLNKNVDAHVGSFMRRKGRPIFIHNPSLVEHVADDNSTLGYGKDPFTRTAFNFSPVSPTIPPTTTVEL